MSAMNRRDLLKLIGIGGVGAVASVVGKEVDAAPVEPPKPVAAQGTPVLPGWGYMGSSRVISGTAPFYMGTGGPYDGYFRDLVEREKNYDFGGGE